MVRSCGRASGVGDKAVGVQHAIAVPIQTGTEDRIAHLEVVEVEIEIREDVAVRLQRVENESIIACKNNYSGNLWIVAPKIAVAAINRATPAIGGYRINFTKSIMPA